ncbi:MAG: hypothetical protein ACYTHJ_10645 [Planctomycetota bacterium]|jgi:hypothetical protein
MPELNVRGCLGYGDGNDHQTLREKPIMQLLAEINPDPEDSPASTSTLSRFASSGVRGLRA